MRTIILKIEGDEYELFQMKKIMAGFDIEITEITIPTEEEIMKRAYITVDDNYQFAKWVINKIKNNT